MGVNSGAGKVFTWFSHMTSVAGLLTWFGISVTYIRFYQGMKVQGYDRSRLPFASMLQPGWEVFLEHQWATDTFVTNYLPLFLYPILYFTARFVTKKPVVAPKNMDFVTNIAEIEAEMFNTDTTTMDSNTKDFGDKKLEFSRSTDSEALQPADTEENLEKGSNNLNEGETRLVRQLKNRHIAMIRHVIIRQCFLDAYSIQTRSIGGVIGTGL
ncbi:hypothetical protein C0991_000028 [Blastosporella zonata]|nr:hypothetical protein C0991_000028 [Blastosporella zonata]